MLFVYVYLLTRYCGRRIIDSNEHGLSLLHTGEETMVTTATRESESDVAVVAPVVEAGRS